MLPLAQWIPGAHASGIVPLKEAVINELVNLPLRIRPSRIQQIEVRLGDGNRMQIGLKVAIGPFTRWFRPEVILDRQALWSNGPGVLLRIVSSQYGALSRIVELLGKGALPPGVHLGSNQVAVEFAALPQASPFHELLRFISRLDLKTSPGVLLIDFELKVTNE
jgi:hypothetical protein